MAEWRELDGALVRAGWPAGAAPAPVAVFDLDDTLCTYRTGVDAARVDAGLRALAARGYRVVVFSNRDKRNERVDAAVAAIDAALGAVGAASAAGASGGGAVGGARATVYLLRGAWRKPHTAAWRHFREANPAPEFYCGDAAGRDGDYSSADADFAHNCRVAFHTPEDVFGGGASAPPRVAVAYPPEADAVLAACAARAAARGAAVAHLRAAHAAQRMCFAMYGVPGCGKSTLAVELAHGADAPACQYVRRDAIRTTAQWWRALGDALAGDARWVVADATFHTRESRDRLRAMLCGRTLVFVAPTFGGAPGVDCWLWAHMRSARVELGGAPVPVIAMRTLAKQADPLGADERYAAVPFALSAAAPQAVTYMRYVEGRGEPR